MSYSSNGLWLGDCSSAEFEILKRQVACPHPSVRYLFPTDGGAAYGCTECGAPFTWDAIEALNVARGGKPGAFKQE